MQTCNLLCLTFFTEHNVFEVHPCCDINQYFIPFLWLDNSLLHYLLIHSSVEGNSDCSLIFLLLGMMLLWRFVSRFLCEHMFSFVLSAYLGVKLLGLIVTLSLAFWKTAKLISKVAAPFYIPTSSVWRYRFPHSFANTKLYIYLAALGLSYSRQVLVPWPVSNLVPLHWECRVLATGPPGKALAKTLCYLSFWLQSMWNGISLWILILISLMTNNVDHLFFSLFFKWWKYTLDLENKVKTTVPLHITTIF